MRVIDDLCGVVSLLRLPMLTELRDFPNIAPSFCTGAEAKKDVFNPAPVGVEGIDPWGVATKVVLNPVGVEGIESNASEPPVLVRKKGAFGPGFGAPGQTIVRQCVVATSLGVTGPEGLRCIIASDGEHCISSTPCIPTCICGLKICSGSWSINEPCLATAFCCCDSVPIPCTRDDECIGVGMRLMSKAAPAWKVWVP